MTFQEYYTQAKSSMVETQSGDVYPIPSKDQELKAEEIFKYLKLRFGLIPSYISPTENGDILIKYSSVEDREFYIEVDRDLEHGGIVMDAYKITRILLIKEDDNELDKIDSLANIYLTGSQG